MRFPFRKFVFFIILITSFEVQAELDDECYYDFFGIFGASKEEISKKGFDGLIFLEKLFPKGLSYDETIRKLMKFVDEDDYSQDFIIRHGFYFEFGVIYKSQVGGSYRMNLCVKFNNERKIAYIDVCTSYSGRIEPTLRIPNAIINTSNN